jgi:hypothetical protein
VVVLNDTSPARHRSAGNQHVHPGAGAPLDAYTVEQLDRYQKTWEVLA